jgi:Putative zinc dependent peptidase (DUF5700)
MTAAIFAVAGLVNILLGLKGTSPALAPARVTVSIDTSGANAVLTAALADPAHAAQTADAALANSAVRAMIAKMAIYDHTVTPQAFKAAVIALANGGSGDPFDLARLRTDPSPTRRMLARLANESDIISRRVADRLQSFTPDGLDIHARLFVLVGAAHQNGWAPDETQPDFYIDLGFHGEEVESVINICTHELFHVIQYRVQPDIDATMTDHPELPVETRERHRADAVLMNLLLEGTATYVGDASLYQATGPHLTHDQRELQRELARATEIFGLFDTVLYRASHDPGAPLATLLRIGFGGSWDQTGYYVGYRMAKTIDRYSGRDRLRTLVTLPPAQFVADYIALARAHPDDPDITPLAPASVATIEELQRVGAGPR